MTRENGLRTFLAEKRMSETYEKMIGHFTLNVWVGVLVGIVLVGSLIWFWWAWKTV
jgi:acid phosphatase family membrane protein YuiD